MISVLKEVIQDPRQPGIQLQTTGREALLKAKKQRLEAQKLQVAKAKQVQESNMSIGAGAKLDQKVNSISPEAIKKVEKEMKVKKIKKKVGLK